MGKLKKISKIMKTTQKLLLGIVGILAVSCSGEPDKMLTVIHSDGSCRREFSAYADSAFMTGNLTEENNPFPVEIDSNYSIAWQYKNGEIRTDFPISSQKYDSLVSQDIIIINKQKVKKGKENTRFSFSQKTYETTFETDTIVRDSLIKGKDFLVFINQNYASIDEMAEKFRLKSSHPWNEMNVQYNFEKKIRFFYTYFSYKEIYPKIELPFDEPVTNYMSEDEANFWFIGNPNLVEGMNGAEIYDYLERLQKKFDTWITKNKWNQQYEMLVEHYDMIKNPPVSKEKFISLRDSIFELHATDKYSPYLIKIMNYSLDNYFKTKVFTEFWEMKNSPMGNFDKEFESQDFISVFGNSFSYQLIMPGEIIHTNGINKNDTLNWNLTAYRMVPADYTIEAQSRKLNIWMLVLIGFLALTAIGIFVFRKKKF